MRYARPHAPSRTRPRSGGGRRNDRELTQQCTHLLSSLHHLARQSPALLVIRIISFAENNPKAYIFGCFALGTILRLAMCHGNWGIFMDPLYPLIHRG